METYSVSWYVYDIYRFLVTAVAALVTHLLWSKLLQRRVLLCRSAMGDSLFETSLEGNISDRVCGASSSFTRTLARAKDHSSTDTAHDSRGVAQGPAKSTGYEACGAFCWVPCCAWHVDTDLTLLFSLFYCRCRPF